MTIDLSESELDFSNELKAKVVTCMTLYYSVIDHRCSLRKTSTASFAVVDPGFFPEGCANSQKSYYFSNFCRKLHENERIWTRGGGGGVPGAPPWIRQCFGTSSTFLHLINLTTSTSKRKNLDYLLIEFLLGGLPGCCWLILYEDEKHALFLRSTM